MIRSLSKFVFVLTGLSFAAGALAEDKIAENYTPPSTPELYDVNEPLVPAYVRVKKVKSHFYLGLGGSVGSSILNGGEGNSKVLWNGVIEAGYVKPISTWTRVDFGVEFLHGDLGNSLNDVRMNFGALAKVGYGYNIAENLYALVRIGYGIAVAKYTGPFGDSSSVTGNILQGAFQLIVPTESSVDILGGIFLEQYGFSDKGSYNAYDVRLGLRVRV